MICERKDKLEIILTNIHRKDANGFGIIKHIEKELKPQIILMSPDIDDIKNTPKDGGNGVTLYIMQSLSLNEINNLWVNALEREKCKRELSSGNFLQKRTCNKRKLEICEQDGGSKDELNVEKKPRIVWTKEMHLKFLEAIALLGHDNAVPKKIVEVMNVPGLTRENVASHLQKYRMCMKQAEEGFTCSLYDFTDPFGLQSVQKSHSNPFQFGSRNTFTSHFGLSFLGSRFKTPQEMSFFNPNQLKKPENKFRVYGDEKKNVLFSIKDCSVTSNNSSFIGFRLGGDGKSVEFGHGGRLDVNENHSHQEMGNNYSTLCLSQSSVAPLETSWTQVAGFTQPPGTGWAEVAGFTQPPSSIELPSGTNWAEPTGNELDANFEILGDFIGEPLPSPEFCQRRMAGGDDGVADNGETAKMMFDDLLFGYQDLPF